MAPLVADDLPHSGRYGCCPHCGVELRPAAAEVRRGGSWHGRDPATGWTVDGEAVSFTCPACRAVLLTAQPYGCRWERLELAAIRWVYVCDATEVPPRPPLPWWRLWG